jgi:hypothetical protein
MHPGHLFGGVSPRREVRFDGLIHDRDKGHNVAERHKRGRLNSVNLVLSCARVSQRNLLLIVDPVLIVRSQASVQDPLFKTQITPCQILGDWGPLGRTRVSGEVRNAGDDATAPMIDDLLRLARSVA